MTAGLACLLAWSGGVAAATVAVPCSPAVGAAAVVLAALAGCLAAALRPAAVGLALAACLLGVARAEIPHGDAAEAERAKALAGAQAMMEGRVADDPRHGAGGYQVLVAPEKLVTEAGRQPPAGRVLVWVRGGPDVGVDDRVEVVGRLQMPRDLPDFDRRGYLAARGAYLEVRNAGLNLLARATGLRGLPGWLRDRYRLAIAELMPPPHSEVLVGVVLGVRTGIPPGLEQELIDTGLVHLLVLSGLKVAVFARLLTGALGPLLGRAATLPALALIALYALAGGATPAAVRASLMGGLTLLAQHLGRPAYVWSSLAAAAAAMLGWNPELTFDVGFQLSFIGTAAIVLLTPGIERRLRWMPAWLRDPFAVTCAAQVGTVPMMATTFHLISPVAPISNAAVLPLLPAMVAAGLLVAPLAAVPEAGRLLALPLTGLLAYLEQVAAVLARVPGAALAFPEFSLRMGLAYYAALACGVAAFHARGLTRRAAILVGLVLPLAIGTSELAAWARPAPSAAVLAVGQGQAVLLSGPAGSVLVDGGPSPSRLAQELGARLPPWQSHLGGLVITGPGAGHVGGLAGLTYSAGVVVVPDGSPEGTAWRAAVLTQKARGAGVWVAHAGQRFGLAGFRFEVLSPEAGPLQPEQLSFRVRGPRGRTFCHLADLDPVGQAAAAARLGGACDVLLLPGGGRSAPLPELMSKARPSQIVVSDGDREPGVGRPLPRGLPRGMVLRTSEEGTIVISM